MLRRVLAKNPASALMKQSSRLLASQRASMSTSHTFDIKGSFEVNVPTSIIYLLIYLSTYTYVIYIYIYIYNYQIAESNQIELYFVSKVILNFIFSLSHNINLTDRSTVIFFTLITF